ncbi:MAG: Asp23/Gls24 family envelope stress response protein [Verrucomicrobia bacterium]|nr:Asp23/Gls24 family envelope stress response protein [Verrucomicrobiota bacterium]MBU4290019.1 Asp23/Gls24 family envelope stress response protein [Verrucomicrobiota bacterium]MBU4430081.1 Asp23/Gls24 family envelope stress response protein [Verrucomicrobiota bacterium]MCG2679610.1 Asp23/Gls24 family envelope stress response protein [Kiritimatiellia bacterium]
MSDHKQPAEVEVRKHAGEVDAEFSEDRADEGTELGAIRVHHGVIAVIARLAALKVPGVVGMSGSFSDGIASMIGKNADDRGIKVTVEGQSVSVELNIVIEYGVRIPQVAWRIQNDVRHAIEDMTGKKVKAVDVVIQGVKCLPENKQEGELP